MSSSSERTKKALETLSKLQDISELISKVQNKTGDVDDKQFFPIEFPASKEGTKNRQAFIKEELQLKPNHLFQEGKKLTAEDFRGNIESFIGCSQVPTGMIGPVRVVGSVAQGDFYVPLATTEGALVASYQRGAKACTLSGGATSICLIESVKRSPVFKFDNLGDLGGFLVWFYNQTDQLHELVKKSSRFAQLQDISSNIEGNHLILTFEFQTGDASGQNMVTICTDQICQFILAKSPIKPKKWYVEGNYSGDKKATSLSFSSVRGKKVTTEITLPVSIVKDVLKSSPKQMEEYWKTSTLGTIQSGAIGAQGHYANGLTALFLATGQDVACIAEAAVGITRMEVNENGDLYASVTLPNLIVGTIGGGTGLPTQKECLELMDCYGEGKARKFAEICGAVVLAGELSIAAALSVGHFTSAHQKLGRTK
ncbi:3-hydroxy-3-methylglutaryl-CoA reductase [Marivirga tractuosa]|uniref:hydroxymethylglutaryl-CoA reductase (NADPH) n=1 Tax=Marivirga tractuosa (strain ATCC 23168 / DSM 4126 / NBRC 15989 / NCIMB 1408 / VKM B-1430 / H-43) TaxID=643867 RepID=E4TQ69_MARTH|nr:hydroxymethylglutaryl-CoA reductase [Marivirga tractuosa]ADR21615.1 3-hydroxy-3-methylglutaryl-coenzyme A reductase [Marivirga tractuosa DSM 4126]BDD13929.1 3-hydroxy-3-methylglutaryl-CoA reductase [Marivirga tractuosa]